MARTLNQTDITTIRQVISEEIVSPESDVQPGNATQPLSGLAEIILLQAMIPLLVSLTSSLLSEYLKERTLASLRRKEIEKIIGELQSKSITPEPEMRDECLNEMTTLLAPMGLNESQIKQIYQTVKERI